MSFFPLYQASGMSQKKTLCQVGSWREKTWSTATAEPKPVSTGHVNSTEYLFVSPWHFRNHFVLRDHFASKPPDTLISKVAVHEIFCWHRDWEGMYIQNYKYQSLGAKTKPVFVEDCHPKFLLKGKKCHHFISYYLNFLKSKIRVSTWLGSAESSFPGPRILLISSPGGRG